MTDSWQPLGVRQGWRAAESMVEGVPDWMLAPVWGWLNKMFHELPHGSVRGFVEQLGLDLRLVLDPSYPPELQVPQAVRAEGDPAGERTLEVADWLLHVHARVGVATWQQQHSLWMPGAPAELERVLSSAGSRWRVSSDRDELQDRVDPTVVAAADEAIAAAAREAPSAAAHLRSAWSAMYGRTPDPKKAVLEAIHAVEAATKPLILGADRATLGEVLRELDKDGRWKLAMPLEWGNPPRITADGGRVLAAMVKIVWHGQGERHGGPTSADPMPPKQAGTIVTTAVALVHLFSAGLVQPVTGTP